MNKVLISSTLVIVASLFFVTNDAIINYLSPQGIKFYHFVFYGAPIFFSVPLYLALRGQFIEKLQATNYTMPIIRGLIFAPMPFITFVSLKNISLPEFTTLNMSSPIFAALLSILILKEKINSLLLLSLFSGISGVILVIQPGFENFNPFFLLVLFGSCLITFTTFIVNKYNKVTSPIGYFVYGGIFIHLLSIILFIIDPLFVDFITLILIIISSTLINFALFFMTFVFQQSQKYYASIFCLVYIQILWSVLIGLFIFNEHLNLLAIIGASFIVLSGIFSIPAQYKQINDKII